MNEHPRDGAPAPVDDHRQPARGSLTCREVVAFLDAYVAGELPTARVEPFERHLAVCPDCRAYLESYRSAIELGRAALLSGESSEVPDELVDSILSALARG